MKTIKTFEGFLNENQGDIVDVLINSMEEYDEDTFMGDADFFGYTEEAMKEIFNDYWSISSMKRFNYSEKDWRKWLKSYKWGLA